MDLNQKEELYLKAKAAYYAGKEIMGDFEFDTLEEELKAEGSHIVDIVDGDATEGERFLHYNPMLSLEKVQVKEDDLMLDAIKKFMNKVPGEALECTPKLDGSALSLIYKDGKLVQALTRGNEKGGLDRTSKARQIAPATIDHPGVVEIRGEVVVEAALYFDKYVDPKDPKNPRNYVAGVIAREEDSPRYNPDAVKDLRFIAYHAVGDADTKPFYIPNTMKFLHDNGFENPEIMYCNHINLFENLYNHFKEFRENSSIYQLDGFVLKFSEEHREKLGANSHHPKWALAIKFPPKEAMTSIESLHWQLGSSGKITPIAIMKPVDLDGSMVTRALLHNLGNVKTQKAFKGAEVIIAKKGDIIPQIIKVTKPSDLDAPIVPTNCPVCDHDTEIIKGKGKDTKTEHLICPNDFCEGKAVKKIERGVKALRIDNLGPATVELLHRAGINNIVDLFDTDKFNEEKLIASGEFIKGRSLEIILNSVDEIKELKIDQVINSLSFTDSGRTISREVGKFMSGVSHDFKGLNKSCVSKLTNEDSEENKMVVEFLRILSEETHVMVNFFEEEVLDENFRGTIEMTGSPKPHFKTKADFLETIQSAGFKHEKLTKDSIYLVTDSYTSSSSKMNKAEKLEVEIITYEDLSSQLYKAAMEITSI